MCGFIVLCLLWLCLPIRFCLLRLNVSQLATTGVVNMMSQPNTSWFDLMCSSTMGVSLRGHLSYIDRRVSLKVILLNIKSLLETFKKLSKRYWYRMVGIDTLWLGTIILTCYPQNEFEVCTWFEINIKYSEWFTSSWICLIILWMCLQYFIKNPPFIPVPFRRPLLIGNDFNW